MSFQERLNSSFFVFTVFFSLFSKAGNSELHTGTVALFYFYFTIILVFSRYWVIIAIVLYFLYDTVLEEVPFGHAYSTVLGTPSSRAGLGSLSGCVVFYPSSYDS